MREPDFHGLREDAGHAAQQPEFATVRRRASRIRARQHLAAGSGALGVVVVLGAVGLAVWNSAAGSAPDSGAAGRPGGVSWSGDPAPEPYIRWAGAGDADHLYALVADCGGCPLRLMASDSHGRRWRERHIFADLPGQESLQLTTASADKLIVSVPAGPQSTRPPTANPLEGANAVNELGGPQQSRISVDGGSTWHELDVTETPLPAAPPEAGVVACSHGASAGDPCPLYAIDPRTGQLAPLATQPPLLRFELTKAPANAGIWVQGYDGATHRPAVAVSRDHGRTWSTAVFAAEAPAPVDADQTPTMFLPNVATADGQTAYAMFAGDGGPPRIYRSTDGGGHWQRTTSDDGTLGDWFLATPESFVTADGAHVLLAQRDGEFAFLASPDGKVYVPQPAPGMARGQLPIVASDNCYLYYDSDLIYLSDDGSHWRTVSVP